MQNILVEENGCYYIDCSKAIWSTDEINSIYKEAKLHLNDVDFVIETENILILIEYKNANIEQAAKPNAFNPSDNKRVEKFGVNIMISKFDILSIDEWNEHDLYSNFPIRKVTSD